MDGALRGSIGYMAAAFFLFAGAAIGTWFYVKSRPSDAERERRRRLAVSTSGRMTDCFISDVQDGVLFYSYSVSGVDYASSQSVVDLAEVAAADPSMTLGQATVKYLPRNPANSIVVCETWSGLRARTERNPEA